MIPLLISLPIYCSGFSCVSVSCRHNNLALAIASAQHHDHEVVATSATDSFQHVIHKATSATDFQHVIHKAIQTLVMSDTDGDELDHSYGSASQGLWLHTPTAKEMERMLNRLVLKVRYISLLCVLCYI